MTLTWDEDWRDLTWPICLRTPPEVVQVGQAIHGIHGHESYLLRDLWCLHLYSYETVLRIGSHRLPIRPGYAGVSPPNVPLKYEFAGPARHLFVHFRCPVTEPNGASHIPALQDLGDDFPRYSRELEEIAQEVARPAHRIQARVWDILGRLADRPEAAPDAIPTAHPAVAHAVRLIALRLSEPIPIGELARECGVSESYLGRLFRETFGTTAVGYVRARRVERAQHLLCHSTLPIKTVAAATGLPDLHFFNKTIRRALGHSPRSLRVSSGL